MSDFDDTNRGVLFKNDSENEKAPAYKGKINVNGQEFELAAWVKTSQKGTKFMSLSVQEPYQPQGQSQTQQRQAPPDDFDDDSNLPF